MAGGHYWPISAALVVYPSCPLSVAKLPRQPVIDAVVTDPTRHFDTENCRTAQGLFDDVIGAGEQCRRHVKSERLGGLEIDHQLVLCWRLHRKVGRFLSLEDAIDVAGGVVKQIGLSGP